jgi:hypothetical protein
MKSLLPALFALLPFPSFASSWENATKAATEAYRQDFKAERGMDAAEPVGFSMERGDEEIITKVYYLEAGVLRSYVYGCHQHGAHFDCHKEDRGEHGAYRRLTNNYNAAAMAQTVVAVLDLFKLKVAPEAAVQTMKLWEAEDSVRFSIGYEKAGRKMEFMMCHFHGGKEIDCHRKGNAGPGEPEKK